jgi:hypothetical protein
MKALTGSLGIGTLSSVGTPLPPPPAPDVGAPLAFEPAVPAWAPLEPPVDAPAFELPPLPVAASPPADVAPFLELLPQPGAAKRLSEKIVATREG